VFPKFKLTRGYLILALLAVGLPAAIGASFVFQGHGEPAMAGGPIKMRRLSEAQYRQSVADIFGEDIKVVGRFEPEARRDGLLAVGDSQIGVSPAGFEQYYAMARDISAQIVDPTHRDRLLPCAPHAVDTRDDGCAQAVFQKFALPLFRRPPSEARMKELVSIAGRAAEAHKDFYAGLQFALVGMLASPDFIFRVDVTEPVPGEPGKLRLDGYSQAMRISYLLVNSSPDAELLAAAARGDLATRRGRAKQIDRLLASPKAEAGIRAFFSDFLGFDEFEHLEKDGAVYPAFNQKVARDAKEQTLRTVVDLLLTRHEDYRDLFTTHDTFMTRRLGMIYGVPVESRSGWEPFHFAEGDPRAGLLAQISFTALHSHPGRSSPTIRGKAIRELLLCQIVPPPPNNVNFAVVQDTSNPNFKTARERLTAHRTEATCAGCHRIVDPPGLALESFDGAGQFRTEENGATIDAGGELNGRKFNDAIGLGQALHDDPASVSCLVNSLYRYAAGRTVGVGGKDWIGWLNQGFADDGYRIPDLMRRIAMSEAFYAIPAPTGQIAAFAGIPESTPSHEAQK
jgi:hypothetical protein